MLISLGFLFSSIIYAGAIEVPAVWGKDLKMTLDNNVAGITSEMVLLPNEKGAVYDGENSLAIATNGSYPGLNKLSNTGNTDNFSIKKITAEKKYADAGFIASSLSPVGTIVKLYDQKLGTSGPELLYVDIGKRQGIEKGDRFTVYSQDRYIYHPVFKGNGYFGGDENYTRRTGFVTKNLFVNPGKPIGYRVVIRGMIEIVESGDEVSSARVLKAYDSIEAGNKLMPYKKFEDLTSAFSETNKFIEGYIVASKGDKIGLKDDDIVYIDKGWDDDVRPGDHFEVYTTPQYVEDNWRKELMPKKNPLLHSVLGEIKIIDTQKKTATAIIVKSKPDMEVGNQVRFKISNHPG